MGSGGSDFVIDIDQEWVNNLRKKIDDVSLRKHRRADPPTIFRVPANMRAADPSAYKPKFIALGPYHHHDPVLRQADNLKLRYLQKLLCRNPEVQLEDLAKLIKGLEARARASYSEDIDMGSDEFVEMMLFDGCFVVELFFMQLDTTNTNGSNDDNGSSTENDEQEEDPVLTTTWGMPLIESDMLMLENQIPFFIIGKIYDLVTDEETYHGTYYPLITLTQAFFNDCLPKDKMIVPSAEVVPRFYHVLHFFHSCIMPAKNQKASQSTEVEQYDHKPLIYYKLGKIKRSSSTFCRRIFSSLSTRRPAQVHDEANLLLRPSGSVLSATRLREAGIKFKKKEANSFLDVEFRDGVMEIPTLKVYDNTNSLFRNLIAFEQCFPKVGSHFAAYTVLMDCLIDTAEDVALLHRYRCIVNGLGDDQEAASLFNRLRKEVNINYESCYLAGLFRDVKKHTDSSWNKWRAMLMHDYFSNPWSVLSFIGALFLIFLTVIQSVLAVYTYVCPPHQC